MQKKKQREAGMLMNSLCPQSGLFALTFVREDGKELPTHPKDPWPGSPPWRCRARTLPVG